MADIRIAIKDEAGIVRRVTKIVQMKDGIAASVPYHSAKEGWLYKFTPEYDKPHFTAPLSEMVHYTASDRVKLSIHLNGFVQFSSSGKKPILSGYDPTTEQPKGIGLHPPQPVNVTTGPLFGIQVRGLEDFELLGERKAMIFDKEDLWYHPWENQPKAKDYKFEFFMFPRERFDEVRTVRGHQVLITELPFCSTIAFRFELRVIELPGLPFFLGGLLHKFDSGGLGRGFSIGGPSCGPPGRPKIAIAATYPKPDYIGGASSLDYKPQEGPAA